MIANSKFCAGLILTAATLTALPAAAETATAEVAPPSATDWKYAVMPYFYMSSMSGESQTGPILIPFNVRFDEVIKHLSWGAMGNFNAQNDQWAVNIDLMFAKLGNTSSNGYLDVHLAQGIYAAVVAKRIQQYAEVYVGARLVTLGVSAKSNFGPTINSSTDIDWVDPIVGMRVNAPISDKVSFNVMADVGGFGVGADYDIQVWPSLQIKIGKGNWRSDIGWRLNYLKYNKNYNGVKFEYQNTLYGPTLGATYTF